MIIEKFEEQVKKFAGKMAIITENKKLTYEELDRYADSVARAVLGLHESGAAAPRKKKKQQVIGLLFEHSADMVVGVLGALKADHIYTPLDITYPENRLVYMLEDSGASLVLTNNNNRPLAEKLAARLKNSLKIIDIDAVNTRQDLPGEKIKRRPSGDKLAYILYTSGSTGRPKGVLQNHENVCYYIDNWSKRFSITPADRMTLFSAFSHDGAGQDMFGALLNGAVLYPFNILNRANIAGIADWLRQEKISIWHSVPTLYRYFVDTLKEGVNDKEREKFLFPDLRFILLGGEQIREHDIEMFKKFFPYAVFANVYGQTESSVNSIWQVEAGASVNKMLIGSPLDKTKILVVDRKGEIIEDIGVGEIYVACPHIALGYWNEKDERSDVFLDEPDLGRIYRTGDLGRLLADGNIEFMGREDSQVKIRGFRIDVGEMETILLTHRSVKETVVVAKNDKNGDIHLCAYIVPKASAALQPGENVFTTSELREYLSGELPAHAIPSYFIELKELPLTPNGKVDRKRLPLPEPIRPKLGVNYVEPETGVEKKISAIWKEILNLDKVGVDDNFFDLGGTSLDIMKVTTKLYDVFQQEIPVVSLFRYPTIRSFVGYLNRQGSGALEPGTAAKNIEKTKLFHIAVIGMSCRFPGARSVAQYWENLKNGVESISFFTDEEMEKAGNDRYFIDNPAYKRAKGIIEDIEYFDPLIFNYSPKETQIMDPQLRMLHECCWEALEDAGCDPETYEGLIGLYAGNASNNYWIFLTHLNNIGLEDSGFLTNNYTTVVSYKLNLRGPSFVLQSACSTSLVAIHLAGRGLLEHECDMALAGGVSVWFPNISGYMYQEGMIFAADGHCRSFDARASGTVFGNGAGIVALKRLEDAIADGDTIHAVMLASGVNNDGRRKVGLASPSVEGQAELIRGVLQNSGIDPESISYLEAHGTGTILGDPVELEALRIAYNTPKKHYCRIGSVKSNLGHMNIAAGVAGFIKATLALEHHLIPPTLNFEIPNPKFDFENSPFVVNNRLSEWQSTDAPLRAAVSAFGIGGTNAHVILEQAPGNSPSSPGRPLQSLMLSAASETALEKISANLVDYFKQNPGSNLADAAYTLQVGRKACKFRKMILCADTAEALKLLAPVQPPTTPETGKVYTAISEDGNLPVVFMFSGQGSQYADMGADLYRTEPIFRAEIDRCFQVLEPLLDYNLKEILFPSLFPDESNASNTSNESYINQTEITQPILFIFEYALAKLLISWGIKPYAMIGHSIGEYVAACLSGVFSLEDALKLVTARGEMMQRMSPGAMLSVPLPEKVLVPLVKAVNTLADEKIALAAVNTTSHCVVSGSHDDIDAFEKQLREQGHEVRRLHTSHAFHSHSMDPILEEFAAKVKQVTIHKPVIPYISNVTGKWISVEESSDPQYWSTHLRRTVRFADGLTQLLKEADTVFIEVGPGRALNTFVNQHKDKKPRQLNLNLVRHPKENVSDNYYLYSKIGRLWLNGGKIDWQGYYAAEKRRRIPLPTYPFERQYYWLKGSPMQMNMQQAAAAAPLPVKRTVIDEWFYLPQWKTSMLPPMNHQENKTPENWLVFIDECGVGSRLVEKIEQAGHHVTIVTRGTSFAAPDENRKSYTIDPGMKEHYQELLAKYCSNGKYPQHIVHLWNVTPESQEGFPPLDSAELETGFYSLLNLAQAIGAQRLTGDIRLMAVTNRMQAVLHEDLYYPQKAAILGPIQVIPKEYTNIKSRSIDIVLPQPNRHRTAAAEKLTDLIFRELSADVEDKQVAWRENYRWVKTYDPYPLEKTQGDIGRLREKGVYLITGGLGGLGLVFAQYLAETVKARLVLTGRSVLPPRQKWDEWLRAHGDQDADSRKIRSIRRLEEAGALVMLISADVTDKEKMQAGVAQAEQTFGPINGIIHAAGVADGALIQLRNRQTSESVLAPKITGTLVLDEILNHTKADFFIFCSSISAVTAPIGQAAYCAANAFMDNFALYKTRKDDTFTVSINWDAWAEVGMAAHSVEQLATGQSGAQTDKDKKENIERIEKSPLDYPLFDRCEAIDERQAAYVFYLKVDRCWFLEEHRILGKPTIPGVTYLELARAALRHYTGGGQGNSAVELSDIYFLMPLVMDEDEEKEARLILKRSGAAYSFSVISRLNPDEDRWLEHARGKAALLPDEKTKTYNVPGIEAACDKKEITYKPEDFVPTLGGITFGPRWNNLRRIKAGANQAGPTQVLAYLELPAEFSGDLDVYKLHPALLDVGVPMLKRTERLFGEATPVSYLPLSYKRLVIKGDLPQQTLFHVSHAGENKPNAEVVKYNIAVMDMNGLELVNIQEFALKMVKAESSGVGQFDNRGSTAARQMKEVLAHPFSFFAAPTPGSFIKPTADSQTNLLKDAILPQEGLDVFTRVLNADGFSQVVVSTIDLPLRMQKRKAPVQEETQPGFQDSKPTGPRLARPEMSTGYTAPRTEVEIKIALVWQEQLGIEKVGIDDDFFELGGDSLKAITLTNRLQRAIDVEIPLTEFFNRPTVRLLAEHVSAQGGAAASTSFELAEKREYYPLSSAQERLFISFQLAPRNTAYNLPASMEFKGEMNLERLETIVRAFIMRHESLRASFAVINGRFVQRIHEDFDFKVEYYDFSREADVKDEITRRLVRPFDLAKPPLVRTAVIKIGPDRYMMFFDFHHIAADALSILVIFPSDFAALKEGRELPPMQIQYKDFAQWQKKQMTQPGMRKKEEFWLEQFKDGVPELQLPYDYDRPGDVQQGFAGARVNFRFEAHQLGPFRAILKAEDATFFMGMAALYNILLYKLTGQEDIVIGTPAAGRSHPDLLPIMGMFVNMLVLRNFPTPDKTFQQFLQKIKTRTLQVLENQDYQFEDLVEKCAQQRDASRNPMFDVNFTLQNVADIKDIQGGLEDSYLGVDTGAAKFDLSLEAIEIADFLMCKFEYKTALFRHETVERFAAYLHDIMAVVIENKGIRLQDITIAHELLEAAPALPELEFKL